MVHHFKLDSIEQKSKVSNYLNKYLSSEGIKSIIQNQYPGIKLFFNSLEDDSKIITPSTNLVGIPQSDLCEGFSGLVVILNKDNNSEMRFIKDLFNLEYVKEDLKMCPKKDFFVKPFDHYHYALDEIRKLNSIYRQLKQR